MTQETREEFVDSSLNHCESDQHLTEWRLRETLEVKRKRFLAQIRWTVRCFASAPRPTK